MNRIGTMNDEQNSSLSIPNSALAVEMEFKGGGEELTREVRITALEGLGNAKLLVCIT